MLLKWERLAKILIVNLVKYLEKNSYECSIFESVDIGAYLGSITKVYLGPYSMGFQKNYLSNDILLIPFST